MSMLVNTNRAPTVCATFVQFARSHQLITGELIAIDGTKLRAVASKCTLVTAEMLACEHAALSEEISRYLALLEDADRREQSQDPETKAVRQALAALVAKQAQLQQRAQEFRETGKTHMIETEPDARLLKARPGMATVGYNLQSAVDGKHGLIVHHVLCQDSSDARQLLPMSQAAKDVLQQEALIVVADAGYSNGEHLAACDQSGITVYVPPSAYDPSSRSLRSTEWAAPRSRVWRLQFARSLPL